MTASLLNYSFSITVAGSHAEILAAVLFSCETVCFVDAHINFKAFQSTRGRQNAFQNELYISMSAVTILTAL